MDGRWRKDDTCKRLSAPNGVEHVAQCGAGCRSDNAYGLRESRNFTFTRWVKKTFGFEHRLEPQKFLKQRAFAFGSNQIRDELILPLRFVDGNLAMHLHCTALL